MKSALGDGERFLLAALGLVAASIASALLPAALSQDAAAAQDTAADKKQVEEIAAALLDDARGEESRRRLIEEHAPLAARVIAFMAIMPEGDEEEEYRRIPWIWRVAVAAGRRNDDKQLAELLDVALPQPGERLRDWQAVVIGGGLINGVSLAGVWPAKRLGSVIGEDRTLLSRWRAAISLAAAMADNEEVRTGTRYDALRMIAMAPWPEPREQLARYLGREVDGELQMGAVSGLGDIEAKEAAALLLANWRRLNDHNRGLALEALLRSDERAGQLLTAVENGQIAAADLGAAFTRRLREHGSPAIQRRARALLPGE